jgi:hypothetical protein
MTATWYIRERWTNQEPNSTVIICGNCKTRLHVMWGLKTGTCLACGWVWHIVYQDMRTNRPGPEIKPTHRDTVSPYLRDPATTVRPVLNREFEPWMTTTNVYPGLTATTWRRRPRVRYHPHRGMWVPTQLAAVVAGGGLALMHASLWDGVLLCTLILCAILVGMYVGNWSDRYAGRS